MMVTAAADAFLNISIRGVMHAFFQHTFEISA
jgi:hypothetical protein